MSVWTVATSVDRTSSVSHDLRPMRGAGRRTLEGLAIVGGTVTAIARFRLFGRAVPLSVTIAPTNRCQGRCSYCDIWKLRQGHERSPEFWIGLLRHLHRLGMRRVGFTGGEALLYPGIASILAEARSLGLLVSLGTNGIAVSEHADVLPHLNYLVVSLDGPRETSDRQRFPGAFDAAVTAVRTARRLGVPVWVTSVVTRETCGSLPGLLAIAEQLDVRINLQLPFHPQHFCGVDNSARFPSPQQMRDILRTVRPHSHAGGRILNTLAYWNHVERWSHLGAHLKSGTEPWGVTVPRCFGGHMFFHVEPDGGIYACAQLAGHA